MKENKQYSEQIRRLLSLNLNDAQFRYAMGYFLGMTQYEEGIAGSDEKLGNALRSAIDATTNRISAGYNFTNP